MKGGIWPTQNFRRGTPYVRGLIVLRIHLCYIRVYFWALKVKGLKGLFWRRNFTATECHLPYGITQCYLPPDTSEQDRLVLNLATLVGWKAELT